jgi:hypothetical protein
VRRLLLHLHQSWCCATLADHPAMLAKSLPRLATGSQQCMFAAAHHIIRQRSLAAPFLFVRHAAHCRCSSNTSSSAADGGHTPLSHPSGLTFTGEGKGTGIGQLQTTDHNAIDPSNYVSRESFYRPVRFPARMMMLTHHSYAPRGSTGYAFSIQH